MNKKFYVSLLILLFIGSSLFAYETAKQRREKRKNDLKVEYMPVVINNPVIPKRKNIVKQKKDNEYNYVHKETANIAEILKKEKKIKIAISSFTDDVIVDGSMFNKPEKKELNSELKQIQPVIIEVNDKNAEQRIENKHLIGLLSSYAKNTNRLDVIERVEINELLREVNFQNSKWVENAKGETINKIYGVDYILAHDLLDSSKGYKGSLSDRYFLSLRLYNVITGKIKAAASFGANSLNTCVYGALNKLMENIVSEAWEARIVKIEQNFVYINAGFKDLLKKGDKLKLAGKTKGIVDPKTGEDLGAVENIIGYIKIEKIISGDLSKASLIKIIDKQKIQIGTIVKADIFYDKEIKEKDQWNSIYKSKKKDKIKKLTQKEFSKLEGHSLSTDIYNSAKRSMVLVTTDKSVGTGFSVGSDGLIVTNYHVVKNSNKISVKLIEDKRQISGVILSSYDIKKDIAVLKVNNLALEPITLGNSDNIKIGQKVYAIGNSKGILENTITDGIVSGIRDFKGIKMIQTSTPISAGNSGGVLLNEDGEVIGITSSGFHEGNIAFAVPINYVKDLL